MGPGVNELRLPKLLKRLINDVPDVPDNPGFGRFPLKSSLPLFSGLFWAASAWLLGFSPQIPAAAAMLPWMKRRRLKSLESSDFVVRVLLLRATGLPPIIKLSPVILNAPVVAQQQCCVAL